MEAEGLFEDAYRAAVATIDKKFKAQKRKKSALGSPNFVEELATD